MKRVKHIIEYGLFRVLLGVGSILPRKLAMGFAALIGGTIATLPLSTNERARDNLRRVFPKKDERWIRQTQYDAMISLVKTFFEFASIYTMPNEIFNKMVKYKGLDNLKNNQNALVLTLHLGNWDVICRTMGIYCKKCGNIYRATNNPYVNKYMVSTRAKAGGVQIPKGAKGARELVKFMKDGGVLGMLMDQKMNDGIEATFLGQPAMTAPALAELAHKYNVPVLPIKSIRKEDGTFEVTIEEPVTLKGDTQEDVQLCNDILGVMVKKHPSQWMWAHKRFKN